MTDLQGLFKLCFAVRRGTQCRLIACFLHRIGSDFACLVTETRAYVRKNPRNLLIVEVRLPRLHLTVVFGSVTHDLSLETVEHDPDGLGYVVSRRQCRPRKWRNGPRNTFSRGLMTCRTVLGEQSFARRRICAAFCFGRRIGILPHRIFTLFRKKTADVTRRERAKRWSLLLRSTLGRNVCESPLIDCIDDCTDRNRIEITASDSPAQRKKLRLLKRFEVVHRVEERTCMRFS